MHPFFRPDSSLPAEYRVLQIIRDLLHRAALPADLKDIAEQRVSIDAVARFEELGYFLGLRISICLPQCIRYGLFRDDGEFLTVRTV